MADKTAISSTKKSIVKAIPDIKQIIAYGRDPSIKSPIVGAIVAEFIGTFLFVTAFFQMQGNPLFVAFTLVGIFLIIGGISGAHINPALTIAAWVTRKIGSFRAIGYIIAQGLGATAAWLMLVTFLRGAETATSSLMSAAAPKLFHSAILLDGKMAESVAGKEWYILCAELLGVTILAFGFATALRVRREKVAAAFSVGLAILIALYVAMSLTTVFLTESNSSLTFLNPVVAFAANGISWTNIWPTVIYILAPIIGAIAGFMLHDFLHNQTSEEKS